MIKAPLLLCTAALAAFAAACGSESSGDAEASRSVVVASANFPENVVLANVYAGALRAEGVEVSTKLNVGSREVLLPALADGEVDVVPEYTGALLDHLTKGTTDTTDTAGQVREIRAALPDGLTLLEPSAAQDQETVTCRPEVVRQHGLRTLEDLAPVSGSLVMGGPPELPGRGGEKGFGLQGLEAVYGIKFKSFRPLDVAGPLTVSALKSGKVDCANLFSTQSAIGVNGFVPLEDPKGLIASQAVVPLVTKGAATPGMAAALDRVSDQLTTDRLEQMVRRVEIDKADPESVAEQFLREHDLG
jgi:osmoprotectant transport system substrate-binding protein